MKKGVYQLWDPEPGLEKLADTPAKIPKKATCRDCVQFSNLDLRNSLRSKYLT